MGTIVPALWGRTTRSYRVGLWPGGKLSAGQSQSSCGPINTCPEWGPLSSPGAQQLCQHFPRVGHCSELTNPHLCDTQRTVPDGKVPTHLSTLLEVWPLPVGKCKGTWCEHFTDVEWNFFMGTFRHRELGVYIVYLCVSELIVVWMLLPQIYC